MESFNDEKRFYTQRIPSKPAAQDVAKLPEEPNRVE